MTFQYGDRNFDDIDEYKKILIMGAPGNGKTALMRKWYKEAGGIWIYPPIYLPNCEDRIDKSLMWKALEFQKQNPAQWSEFVEDWGEVCAPSRISYNSDCFSITNFLGEEGQRIEAALGFWQMGRSQFIVFDVLLQVHEKIVTESLSEFPLFVDDADFGLHPAWQRRLVQVLGKHGRPLVASTHSDYLAGMFRRDQVLVLE
jgi:hypothetical protein